jgi:hypothetical protein
MIHYLKPVLNDDSDNNGGIASRDPVLNNVKNNVLPDVPASEVSSGITRYRKIFITPQMQLPYLRIYLRHPSTAQDQALICNAEEYGDIQTDAEGYEFWKGAGILNTALTAGSITEIIVDAEVEGYGFNPLDLVRLSDGTNEQFIRIYDVSWSGSIATLSLPALSYATYSFASGSYVSAVIEKGIMDLEAVWLKEIVPTDIAYSFTNINRIRFRL